VGGEEFMVLLPQVVLSVGQSVAERIREAIANAAFGGPVGKSVSLTVSIGVSQFGHDGDTIDEILRAADERLYRAKHQGRNRLIAV
jgi:diguanylate cyclase (GGDEF)-like protein